MYFTTVGAVIRVAALLVAGGHLVPSPVNERKAFLFVLVVLGVFFALLLKPVVIPVLLASIITVLFYPMYAFFLRRFGNRCYLASFAATLSIFLMLVLPISLVITQLVHEAIAFVSHANLGASIAELISQRTYQNIVQPLLDELHASLNVDIDIAGIVASASREAAQFIYKFSPQVLGKTVFFIFSFFVMHVTLFFLFIEGKGVFRIAMDLSPLQSNHEQRLVRELKNMIYATVYGYLLTALVQGILAGIGFAVAGVKAPLVFGTLTFFMSMVPILGATSVWLPIAIVYLIMGKYGWGIFILVYGAFVISGIDNFLKPWIMQGKAKVHILLIFFSLLGGIALFGPIGILLGPVIVAMFLACIYIYREDFLAGKSREMP